MRTIDLRSDPDGHAAPVTHVAFRADGRRLATCSYDGTVLVWDTDEPSSPLPRARLRHRRLVNASAWNPVEPELLATASADKTVAIWRVPDRGRPLLVNVLARHTDDVNSVAWAPDGRHLVCVSEDGRASMWDGITGALLGALAGHTDHCMMVAVSRHGLVATVGEDGLVSVSRFGRTARSTSLHYSSSVEGCAWSHSGETLAVACDDGTVDLLTPRLEKVRTVTVSTSAARSIAWSDDDRSFVVGAYDGSLHFFNVSGERIHRVYDARLWPRSVAVAGSVVAVGSFRGGPHLLDSTTGTKLCAPGRDNHGPNALAVLGGELLVGCDSGTVFAVGPRQPDGARDVRALQVSGSPVLSLAAYGRTLYAGTYDGRVIRAAGDPHGEKENASVRLDAPVPSLCVAGDRVIAGTYNGKLAGLDPLTLSVVDRGTPHRGSVKSLAAFGGGFLSASTDRTVAAGSLHRRETLWEHGNLVNSVAGLDGRVVATASRDHTVKVGLVVPTEDGRWRVVERQTLPGPDESVKCVALLGTPQAPVVLAGSYDFGLYIWQVDWNDSAGTLVSGRLLAEFGQGVSSMCRLDDRRVAVAGWDGRILIAGQDEQGTVRELERWDIDEMAHRAARDLEEVAG